MKVPVLLFLVALATASAYDYRRYDDFDIDEVVNNERLMIAQVKCFLGTGRCTPQGADIKEMIPDALQKRCSECSAKQKIVIARVMQAVIEKLPKEWKELNKLHNPDGKYDDEIKEFVNEYASKSN